MKKIFLILITITLGFGCATTKNANFDILKEAEKGGANVTISGVGDNNTSPASTTYIEGETAGGTSEHFTIANMGKAITFSVMLGYGTGVTTALAIDIGSAGAPVVFNGDAGQPSAIDLLNATNFPSTVTLDTEWDTPAEINAVLETTENITASTDPYAITATGDWNDYSVYWLKVSADADNTDITLTETGLPASGVRTIAIVQNAAANTLIMSDDAGIQNLSPDTWIGEQGDLIVLYYDSTQWQELYRCSVNALFASLDMSGGTLYVPNGANPTIDAAGKVGADTSPGAGSGFRFYGDQAYQLPGRQYGPPIIVKDPDADSDYPVFRAAQAITIVAVHYLCTGGTSWTGQLQEADANGGSGADTQAADTTASAGTTSNVTSFSNASIDAGDIINLKTTSISGTPTNIFVQFEFTVDLVN